MLVLGLYLSCTGLHFIIAVALLVKTGYGWSWTEKCSLSWSVAICEVNKYLNSIAWLCVCSVQFLLFRVCYTCFHSIHCKSNKKHRETWLRPAGYICVEPLSDMTFIMLNLSSLDNLIGFIVFYGHFFFRHKNWSTFLFNFRRYLSTEQQKCDLKNKAIYSSQRLFFFIVSWCYFIIIIHIYYSLYSYLIL